MTHWIRLAKIAVLCLVAVLLYKQVFGRADAQQLWAAFEAQAAHGNVAWLLLLLALMPVNWALETQKWRVLMHRTEPPIAFWAAFGAVFAGVTFSIFTPNRIGEYGGRMLMVKADKWQTVVATIVGSFSQMIVLIGVGLMGATYYATVQLHPPFYYIAGLPFIAALSGSIMLFFYYNIDLTIPIVRRIPYLRRGVRHLEVLREYTNKQLSLVLFYSVLRYFVYCFQYYLLLMFFEIKIHLLAALTYIAFIFLIQTLLPGIGLLARGEIAVNIWGEFQSNPIIIFSVSFGLWLVNVVLAALIGMIFIANTNISLSFKSFGYEKNNF